MYRTQEPAMRRPPLLDIFGLRPLPLRLKEAWLALRGDAHTPRSQFDYTSLKIMQPWQALQLWSGRNPAGRRVEIFNLYNHTQTAAERGWSTRVRQVSDFQGGQDSYDSHNGTDFALPPGSLITAGAAGLVLRVSSEFNRGGLKIFIDHGAGLVTTSNHLAQSFVQPGQRVARGQVIARSGYSGLDGFALFPWMSPHIHYNVWLNGLPIDPFARPSERSLWRTGDNWPTPADAEATAAVDAQYFEPTVWDEALIEEAIAQCKSAESVREMRSYTALDQRAMAVLMHQNYYPTRFHARPSLYRTLSPRSPRLDLPLHHRAFEGICHKRARCT